MFDTYECANVCVYIVLAFKVLTVSMKKCLFCLHFVSSVASEKPGPTNQSQYLFLFQQQFQGLLFLVHSFLALMNSMALR